VTRLPLVKPSSATSAAPSSSQTFALKKIVATSLMPLPARSRKLWARSKLVTSLPDWVRRSSGALVRRPLTVMLMLVVFLHWFGAVRAALVVEGPGFRQRDAARKRRKKVIGGVADGLFGREVCCAALAAVVAQPDSR
jgi:hypothetical protein